MRTFCPRLLGNAGLRWAAPEGCQYPQQCENSGGPSRGRNVMEKILTSSTWFGSVVAETPASGSDIYNLGLGEARVKVSTSSVERKQTCLKKLSIQSPQAYLEKHQALCLIFV